MLYKTLAILFFVSAAYASYPQEDVQCGNNDYPSSQIQQTVGYAVNLRQNNQKIGSVLSFATVVQNNNYHFTRLQVDTLK